MNISTGGPHILLFERDQQLTALLMSEFQLAGYEFHAARTAVEVFDSIARYPVRLVLVNLAQAAATRREFWVALDTQRRGRGLQVLTFTCANLAGYGSRDADERSQMPLSDMHIEGMQGIMNLVEAVRARVPGSGMTSNTQNTQPRMQRIGQMPPMPQTSATQTTGTIRPVSGNTAYAANGSRGGIAAEQAGFQPAARSGQLAQSSPNAYPVVTSPTVPNMPNTPTGLTPLPGTGSSSVGQQNHTDRIRAVLYPGQRPNVQQNGTGSGTIQENSRMGYETGNVQSGGGARQSGVPTTPTTPTRPTGPTGPTGSDVSMLQRLASGQDTTQYEESGRESGLAQLSRMVQERRPAISDGVSTGSSVGAGNSATSTSYQTVSTMQAGNAAFASPVSSATLSPQIAEPVRPAPVSEPVQILRASPIQDLPAETNGMSKTSSEETHRTGMHHSQYGQPIAQPTTPVNGTPALSSKAAPLPSPTIPMAAIQPVETHTEPPATPAAAPDVEVPSPPASTQESEAALASPVLPGPLTGNEDEEGTLSFPSKEAQQQEALLLEQVEQTRLPNGAMLLDIVQSLPPMSSPPPQPLQGRATRALGSVLLEGHLVPQDRLEVAQGIQRMLRGVDLNYQLGEILLMFKLLTPDQLLAASLVSYGLISTQQIVALGRIRQELHSIGLEYDLENLLILFRMLSPDQLREVRSSWRG